MNNFEIHNVLLDVMKESYPNLNKAPFIELINKNMESKHGDYNLKTRRIRIFNLYRETDYIICCAIHELAHYVEHMTTGTTGHQKSFYEIYRKLMETAVRKGYFNYNKMRDAKDVRDIRQQEKYFGAITVSCENVSTNLLKIEVSNCFDFKEQLKQRNYKWDGLSKVWVKTMPEEEALEEVDMLQKMGLSVRSYPANEIKIEAYQLVMLTGKGTYESREFLKENGYRFDSSNKAWAKKVNAKELQRELNLVRNLNLSDVVIKSVGI